MAAADLEITLQPKQELLLDAIRDRRLEAPTVIGYGGSRGAAKSGGVRRIALTLAFEQPVIIWIIRRVWDDLNKDHVQPMFREQPDLKQYWRAQDRELRLPNGSSIFFIHSGDAGRAKRKARGPQAHYIFLEQAEEFSQDEMEQLAGSNRAPGVPPGFCKRIYTFNPGGIGTNYLRRIFHLRQYHDNERPDDFLFLQAYGWDNYEWFRGLGIVEEWEFYSSPEWAEISTFTYFESEVTTSRRAFEVFIKQTDFGRKLAALPQSQRIGELMGSFEKFAGQYFAEVWEESATVLAPDLVARIVQPWWKRWLATDWGFSHYAATGWFTSGVLAPEQVKKLFGVDTSTSVRIVILYREAVCNDVAEPDLAKLIVSMTPEAERREVRHHFIGHDAFAKRGAANTVVEQMDPELTRGRMQPLSRADIDRVGGWRLMYNCWASARRLRTWPGGQPFTQHPDDMPAFFVSAACAEVVSAVPMLICDEDNPQDVRKLPGAVEDDVGDMVRYGLKSYLAARTKAPDEVITAETYERYQDPTARAMAMLRLNMEQSKSGRLVRRRRL
ncbi:MAG: phage terminase large subunit [Patescibacteria group bacterium]|nr:phage terminase large subunit [Patescibacteria group bacterium]